MTKIIGTRTADDKIYQLTGSPLAWSEFPVQPSFGSIAVGIWGGPNNTIWCHNGKPDYLGGTPKYLFFNGGSWSEHTCPSISYSPRSIHGSIDGSIVYAGGQGYIHKYSSGVWSVSATGVNIGTLWCDETGQYIWGTPGPMNGQNIWHSDDYGATWTDVYSQFITDIDTYWSPPFYNVPYTTTFSRYLGGIWGISENEVYTTMGYKWTPFLTYEGCAVFKWDGTKWFEVAQRVSGYGFRTYDYGGAAYVRMGLAAGIWKEGDRFVCAGLQGGSVGLEFFRTYEDSNWGETPLWVTGAYTVTDGRCILGNDGNVIAAYDYSSGNAGVFISDDAFETYTDMTVPWTGIDGLQSLTLFGYITEFPPYLQNQDPASGSSGNPGNIQIYLEVVDDLDDIIASSIDIYINDVLAWSSESAQTGFSAYSGSVTKGYSYTITPDVPLSSGTQKVRVIGTDLQGLPLDETYFFDTVWVTPTLESPYSLFSFDFPLQFEENGNARLTYEEKALNDNIKLSVFIRPYGIPLFPLGVGVQDYAFDPNDEILHAELEVHITDGLSESVEGIKVDSDFTFSDQGSALSIGIPYLNVKKKKNSMSVISVPRQKVE